MRNTSVMPLLLNRCLIRGNTNPWYKQIPIKHTKLVNNNVNHNDLGIEIN